MADTAPRARQLPSWAEIPPDLAGKVLSLLPTHADRVRFAAVCPQWRSASRQLRLPRPLPVLALPDGTVYSLPDGKPLHFPGLDLAAGFKTACGSWLVFRRDDGCFLVDPFTGTKGKLYAVARDENLRIVNISEGTNSGDPQVTKGDPFNACIDSVVKKKIYLVESCGTLLMVRRKVFCREEDVGLVAGQSEFEVFKVDLEQSLWVNVTTLGDDQMLFLGRPCSRAVSASQYGMLGDQIFFLDDVMENVFEGYTSVEENTSVSAYNMRNGEVSSPLPMVWDRKMVPPAWLFPCD